jgi:tetratricopeptide (TPR) repeat protein
MGTDIHLSRSLINIIYFFIFFLILVNHGIEDDSEEKNVKILKILVIFIASSTIAGFISLLQLLGAHIFPWDFAKSISFNTIGSMTNLGIFMAAVLPLSLGLLFSIKQKGLFLLRGLLIVFAGLSLIILLLLNFPNLWTVAAIGMIVLSGFLLAKQHFLKSQNLAWLAIPIAILALSLIFLFFKPGLFNLELPMELGLTQNGGINIIKKALPHNPALGLGPESFIYGYALYKPATINQTIFWNVRFTSGPSEILSLLPEIGILGLLTLVALLGIFLTKTIKNLISSRENSDHLAEIKIGIFSAWLTLLISWFLCPQNIVLLFVFWLLLSFLTVINSEEKDVKIVNLKTSNKVATLVSFGFIIIMIAITGLLYLEGSKFVAEAKYQTGLKLIDKGELDAGIDKIIRATVTNPYEDRFYKGLAQFFILQINQNLKNQTLDPQNQANKVQVGISSAINSAVRSTTLDSKNVDNWIIRGFVYRSLIALVDGAGDWAIKSYEIASTLEPGNPFIYLEIGRTYVNEADLLINRAQKDSQAKSQMEDYLSKAVDAYSKAIELKSNYAAANYEIALAYDRQGKTNEAISKMQNSLQLAPQDTGVIFQLGVLYYKTSQFDKAKAAFAKAVSLDSNFSNARYFLGLLLDKEGNKSAAIEQFEKIAELNPDNELVRQILTNLKAGKPALSSSELTTPEEAPIQENQPTRGLPGGD